MSGTQIGKSTVVCIYGPWFSGSYDAEILGVRKKGAGRFTFDVSYTHSRAIDNLLSSNLYSNVQQGVGVRLTAYASTADSFVSVPPVVVDAVSGQSNAHGPFIARRLQYQDAHGTHLERGYTSNAVTF